MNEAEITRYITDTFRDVKVQVACRDDGSPEIAWGDTFFYYAPASDPPSDNKFPFATIVTKDYGDFDCASNLNRPGVFRLNVGVSKQTFAELFGAAKPEDYDFAVLNKLMPHPVYGKMYWVCVLNPSATTFEASVKPLLAEAHETAAQKATQVKPFE